jgi:hypothetical protein
MHIPMMMLVLTAFDTKCTVVAFQPRPQRTSSSRFDSAMSRFSHDSDDMRVRLAVLETNMNLMGKTLERIEKDIGEVRTEPKKDIGSLETEVEEVNGRVDGVIFGLITASMVFSNLVGLGALGPLIVGFCLLNPYFFGFRLRL